MRTNHDGTLYKSAPYKGKELRTNRTVGKMFVVFCAVLVTAFVVLVGYLLYEPFTPCGKLREERRAMHSVIAWENDRLTSSGKAGTPINIQAIAGELVKLEAQEHKMCD